ncbi:MAG: addiction module protein [Planctomycetota bacterium]
MTGSTVDLASLSATEKLLLAQQLLDAVLAETAPLTLEQLTDVHRRAAAIDGGQDACEAWEVARARLLPPA